MLEHQKWIFLGGMPPDPPPPLAKGSFGAQDGISQNLKPSGGWTGWVNLLHFILFEYLKLRKYPGGGGVLGSGFAGYVPLASQSPYPIIVYSVANYRPHLSHFWANVIAISRTKFNASRLLNIKTTAGTIFQPRIFLFLNPYYTYQNFLIPKNLRPHSSNSTENVTPL